MKSDTDADEKEEGKSQVDEKALLAAGITAGELSVLAALSQTDVWIPLLKYIKHLKLQGDFKVRDIRSSVDVIRYNQGRIGTLNELVNFLADDLPEWYKTPTRPKGGREA